MVLLKIISMRKKTSTAMLKAKVDWESRPKAAL